MAMDDPSAKGPRPELVRRGPDPRPRDAAADAVGAGAAGELEITPEQRARAERLILTKGVQAARALEPWLVGRCIECFKRVEGNRAFCSDACISGRVRRNHEKVAAIAREIDAKKSGR